MSIVYSGKTDSSFDILTEVKNLRFNIIISKERARFKIRHTVFFQSRQFLLLYIGFLKSRDESALPSNGMRG